MAQEADTELHLPLRAQWEAACGVELPAEVCGRPHSGGLGVVLGFGSPSGDSDMQLGVRTTGLRAVRDFLPGDRAQSSVRSSGLFAYPSYLLLYWLGA